MKKLMLVLGLAFFPITNFAQNNRGATVTVTIENVLSSEGTLLVGLHNVETFMKGPGLENAMAPATKGEVTLVFEHVPEGTYAIMAMHDVNNNNQMDMEINGMPKESYATSGEINLYGPPTFDGAKFAVTGEDITLRIRF